MRKENTSKELQRQNESLSVFVNRYAVGKEQKIPKAVVTSDEIPPQASTIAIVQTLKQHYVTF